MPSGTRGRADVRLSPRLPRHRSAAAVARTLELAVAAAEGFGKIGLELSLGTQAADRMVGEPTTFTKAWFDAFPAAVDATPLLVAARAIKTEQEVARMRIANEIAADAMEQIRAELRPGMKESQAAAIWQGFVHGQGTGWRPMSSWRCRSRSSGRGAGSRRSPPRRPAGDRGRARALRDLGVRRRLLGRPHEEPRRRRAPRDYRELEEQLVGVYEQAIAHCRPGASFPELDVLVRDGLDGDGLSRPADASDLPRHRRPRARAAVCAPAGGGTIEEGMVLAIEPGVYWQGGGGLRVEDNFLIGSEGAEKLSAFPDGVVRCG